MKSNQLYCCQQEKPYTSHTVKISVSICTHFASVYVCQGESVVPEQAHKVQAAEAGGGGARGAAAAEEEREPPHQQVAPRHQAGRQ